MNVELAVQGLDAGTTFVRQFGRKLPAATARAINRAIRFGFTRANRGITAETGLQRKNIVPSLSIRPATENTLEAALMAKPKRVPLIAYMLKGFRSGRGVGSVPYSVGVAPPHAFQARFKSGKRVVAERRGRERSKLRVLTGEPIPKVIVDRHVYEAIKGPVGETFDKRMQHEIDRLQGRAGGPE